MGDYSNIYTGYPSRTPCEPLHCLAATSAVSLFCGIGGLIHTWECPEDNTCTGRSIAIATTVLGVATSLMAVSLVALKFFRHQSSKKENTPLQPLIDL